MRTILRMGGASLLMLGVFCGTGAASATTSDLRVRSVNVPCPVAVVSLAGNTAAVGMPAFGQVPASGAVDIFTRSGGRWTLTQQLTTPKPAKQERFGLAIAMSGSTIAAFAGRPDRVLIFQQEDGTWVPTQTLTATAGTGFGTTISMSGSLMVIGEPGGGPTGDGAAEVYELTGGSWTFTQEIVPADPGPHGGFGLSVATNGTQIVVGALAKPSFTGRAYSFGQVGGVWTEQQRLAAPESQTGERFGVAIAASGRTLAVSAPEHQIQGAGSLGAVYAYRLASGTGKWRIRATLAPPADDTGASYGWQVSTDGDAILVSADSSNNVGGAALLYTRVDDLWGQAEEFTSPTSPTERFGVPVAVEPRLAMVGQVSPDARVFAYSGRVIR